MDPEKPDVDKLEWYKRPTWLASLAGLVAAVAFAAFVVVTVRDSATLDAIKHQQRDIDELLCFVNVVMEQPVDGQFRELLDECMKGID